MNLLSRYWTLGLIPVFLFLVYLWTGAIGREAVLKQQIKAREKTIAALAVQKARVDTQYTKAKTVYLPAKATWDDLKLTLRDPIAIIALADSTIRKCEAVVTSCEAQVATRDTIIWQQDSLIHDLKKKKPFLLRIGKPILPFLGGVVTGMILTK
jgi:hypothetical protein